MTIPGRRRRSRAGRSAPGGELASADAGLLRVVDGDMADAARRAGERLACGPGCDECCHGPFPITALDVWRLRRGLADLARTAPERATAIGRRARAAVAVMRDGYPGDAATGRLVDDVPRLDAFFTAHAGLACPALDPASGRCELYAARPIACRTYGPPLRFGDEHAAPCRLCFVGAPPAEVERCRVAPDRDDVEASVLARLGAGRDGSWASPIAHALSV